MSNTSATGGMLTQTAGPTEGQTLRRFLQTMVAGVTGLTGDKVRQSWQQNPPPVPGIDVDWCGVGIAAQRADANGSVEQLVAGNVRFTRYEELEVMCSFYGPGCLDYAGRLRDGLQISQNREALFLAGMGFVACDDLLHTPELVNDRYYDRADLTVHLRREVRREYAILSFVSAYGTSKTDGASALLRNWTT